MDKYITGMLEEDARFKLLAQKDPRAWKLVMIIRERAEGVFLWVYLVVKRLLRLLGERTYRFDTLLQALDELPSDLDKYFRHIIDTIEETHRQHTAGTFRLALFAAPLPLIAFWFLPVVLDRPDEVLKLPIGGDPDEVTDDRELVMRTTDTINAWCKDLLEVHRTSDSSGPVNELHYKIDFLHRTVRDFLADNSDMQKMFREFLRPDFDCGLTLMRLLLAQAKSLTITSQSPAGLETFGKIVQELMTWAQRQKKRNGAVPATLLYELDRVGCYFHGEAYRLAGGEKGHWTTAIYGKKGSFLALAVGYELYDFVKAEVVKEPTLLTGGHGALLLDYALQTRLSPGWRAEIPIYDMVLLLLEGGADANMDSEGQHGTNDAAWKRFLRRCWNDTDEGLWPVLRLLLKFGADPTAEFSEGALVLTRVVNRTSKAGRTRQVEIPDEVSVERCLMRVCGGNQLPECKTALEEAKVAYEASHNANLPRPSAKTRTSWWARLHGGALRSRT